MPFYQKELTQGKLKVENYSIFVHCLDLASVQHHENILRWSIWAIAGQLQGEWQAVDICMGRVVAVIVRVLPSNNARFSAWITTSFCLSGAKTTPKEIIVKLYNVLRMGFEDVFEFHCSAAWILENVLYVITTAEETLRPCLVYFWCKIVIIFVFCKMLAAVNALCSCLGDLPLLVQRLEMLRGIFWLANNTMLHIITCKKFNAT